MVIKRAEPHPGASIRKVPFSTDPWRVAAVSETPPGEYLLHGPSK